VERVTVKVVRGAPGPRETAALMAVVLGVAAGRARTRELARAAGAPPRPTWQPFTGHADGGWGRP
jgi:hypothetical protein